MTHPFLAGQKDARARNTHSSTAIEGNPLTLEQVRELEEGRPLAAVAQRSQREVWEAIGVSKQAATKLMKPLLEAQLVRRVGSQKAGRYILSCSFP